MTKRRIDYEPDGGRFATVLDHLVDYQRATRTGNPAEAAAAARRAEGQIGLLVDEAMAAAIQRPSSARKASAETGIAVSTITHRARRYTRRAEDEPAD